MEDSGAYTAMDGNDLADGSQGQPCESEITATRRSWTYRSVALKTTVLACGLAIVLCLCQRQGFVAPSTRFQVPGEPATTVLGSHEPQIKLSHLGRFLRDQKMRMHYWEKHRVGSSERLTMVVGNEASDADSIISALTYAYLKTAQWRAEHPVPGENRFFIPAVKCNRKHMRLRQETLAILSHVGVNYHDLVHFDDNSFSPLMALVDEEDPSFDVILVDHNEADGLLKGKVDNRVAEILDHHIDLAAHEAKKEVIAFDGKSGVPTVQSACTVIANQFLRAPMGPGLLQADDGAVASALLSVILIDSKGLGDAASSQDLKVAEQLRADIKNPESQEHLHFKWLSHKKENPAFWSSATLEENLLYDFKQFEAGGFTCGIASTFLSLANFKKKLNDEEQASALQEYVEDPLDPESDSEVQSTVMIVMLKRDPKHLAVVSKHPGLQAFSKKFLLSPKADILAPEFKGASSSGIDFYLQGSSKASRKQVAPTCQEMLRAFRHHQHV
eukprot:TRINITY_DN122685_c0_g1_i1.p1 TRINITY_DN122685_c0_g1~~TRINITY_DN122685_c0_g1_i1.p1  ORF type:complete len:501 (-),score=98.93 TRINITY_DN122685_c0_g1_i1:298-1800(-)